MAPIIESGIVSAVQIGDDQIIPLGPREVAPRIVIPKERIEIVSTVLKQIRLDQQERLQHEGQMTLEGYSLVGVARVPIEKEYSGEAKDIRVRLKADMARVIGYNIENGNSEWSEWENTSFAFWTNKGEGNISYVYVAAWEPTVNAVNE